MPAVDGWPATYMVIVGSFDDQPKSMLDDLTKDEIAINDGLVGATASKHWRRHRHDGVARLESRYSPSRKG